MKKHVPHKKLNELASTAICGNDISSSVLYVSALAILFAQQYAWITLLIVAVILFFFRKIYGEVVGALPLNGGAYNALLNTTSKSMASLAATLTLLSYMATAVISANEAMHYLHHLFESLPIMIATMVLLAIFAGLTIMGITESAKVAIGIFVFHLASLVVLTVSIGIYIINNGLDLLWENFKQPFDENGVWWAIFLGFAASMLGISGFESSANFVEEQERGVFPKTLRNMWVVVSIFNPLMAFLAMAVIPIPEINAKHSTTLLSHMGEVSAGEWLSWIVSIDAVLVLSGAVLTSFVGVSGLLERMALDRILPQYFLKKNKRGSSYRIIIWFFILSTSVLYITNGEVKLLAGVYTLSFLSVMGLFVIGNVLLKINRKRLPRPEKAPWYGLLIAMLGVTVALVGNIVKKPDVDADGNPLPATYIVFLEYFIPVMLAIVVMLNRIPILKIILSFMRPLVNWVLLTIRRINSQEFVFFTKGHDVATLNKVMLYIRNNEQTRNLKIVTVLKEGEELPAQLESDLEVLDREYPEIKIEFICLRGEFVPSLIKELSQKWNIPINFMFIGSPGDHFPYRVEELGGVRLII